jgi:hypothetical protein
MKANEIIKILERLFMDPALLVVKLSGGWGWYRLKDVSEAERVGKMMSIDIADHFREARDQDFYVLYDQEESPRMYAVAKGTEVFRMRGKRDAFLGFSNLSPRILEASKDFLDKMRFTYYDEKHGEGYYPK